jgi:hypothetical protein
VPSCWIQIDVGDEAAELRAGASLDAGGLVVVVWMGGWMVGR